MRGWWALALAAAVAGPVAAHPGGLAADGCHNDRRNGGRHCHGGGARLSPARRSMNLLSSPGGRAAFANCTAARLAGAAPVRRGDPGYGAHLDRDNDGVGCE